MYWRCRLRPRPAASLLYLALVLAAMASFASAQDLQPPPDFSQGNLQLAAEDTRTAWASWQNANKGLEQQVYGLPMLEARDRIQKAFSELIAFLDKRRAYNDGVIKYIEKYRPEMATISPAVTVDTISADQVAVLGVNLAAIQDKLDSLRVIPDWARIRRAILAERNQILELQNSRRRDIQVDLPMSRRVSAPPISSIVYRETESQVREALQTLWTNYYQTLVGSVEQKPNGSAPLAASATPPVAETQSAKLAGKIPAAKSVDNPLIGTWTYSEGSQQFNGVAEPHQVVLELWIEKGMLTGRYRAHVPDFDGGLVKVDLTLTGKPAGSRTQTLDFRSSDPAATGKITLQGSGTTGLELMLVRSVEAGSPIPRGRELLIRR